MLCQCRIVECHAKEWKKESLMICLIKEKMHTDKVKTLLKVFLQNHLPPQLGQECKINAQNCGEKVERLQLQECKTVVLKTLDASTEQQQLQECKIKIQKHA